MDGKSIGLLGGVALLLSACGGDGGSSSGGDSSTPCDEFDCQAMVDNLATGVMLPTMEAFASRADTLQSRVKTYHDALDDGDPDTNDPALDAARDAWKEAMTVWQHAELMQVGPLRENSGARRDTIYSWPATSSCEVDQDVILAEESGYDISGRTPKRRGLDALGYILFTDTPDHTCPGAVEVTQGWDDRGEADRGQTRADFAVLAADDLASQAADLATAWEDFTRELEQPGSGDSRFDSVEEAVNALSDALFYLEKQTNDIKLANPPGFQANRCGGQGTICPEEVESPFSRFSRQNVVANMDGFRQMFTGDGPEATAGPGFADFLEAQGGQGENIAQTMLDDLDDAKTELEDITVSLYEAVQDDNERNRVRNAFDKLTEVNRQLKDQFLRVLGLSIPDAAAGDGD